MNSIKIIPAEVSRTFTVSKIVLHILEVNIFVSAKIMVALYDSNNYIIDNRYFDLTTEEYDEWGSDDNYLVSLMLSKLSLTQDTTIILPSELDAILI